MTSDRAPSDATIHFIAIVLAALAALVFVTTASAQTPPTNADCLGCHQDMTPALAGFDKSVHGVLSCTDCHADIKAVPHEGAVQKVACTTCHEDAQTAWDVSLHAAAVKKGNAEAPKCISCHGAPHQILPSSDAKSPTFHTNIPKMCGSCHGQKFVMEKAGLSTQMFASYQESVHGRAVAKGSTKAAVCTDCHDHHAVQGAASPQSSIFKFNVPRTCGKCHVAISAQFVASVHGTAVARGNWTAPVCTDCHGIHAIKSHVDPASPVSPLQLAEKTCAKCHDGVRLSQEFGVPAGRVESYQSSYHGLAKKLGSPTAANCASCHGVHNILPSSDVRSMTNKANLQKTCGHCHDGVTAKFIMGRVHLTAGETVDTQSKSVTWIRRFYLLLIWSTIGFMLAHNLLLWVRKALKARRDPGRTVVRMTRTVRIQHFLLLSSFTVLVLTGFALAYPDSIFAWMFGSSEVPRRIIHRIAGVVMIALGVYHVAFMAGTKEGRQGVRDFWFRWKDARDLFDVLKYYLGLSDKPARMGRFTYGEKMEYWAVVWGTIVMGVTGLMIWYNVTTSKLLPRWWIDVATTIHFYEAILATLAIIVWHLYNVIADPDAYPMNWAWFDGKMSKHYYEHEHALAAEELRKDEITAAAAKDEEKSE